MKELNQKEKIIEMLQTLQNTDILDTLEKLLFKLKYEEETSKPLTNEQFESEIKMSLRDLEEGRVISKEALQKEVLTW